MIEGDASLEPCRASELISDLAWPPRFRFSEDAPWEGYTTSGWPTVLFIGPGTSDLLATWNPPEGVSLEVVNADSRYDGAAGLPHNWEAGSDFWPMEEDDFNLMTFGSRVVVPRIKQLIDAGRGPAAVVCGSRGGDGTIRVVWRNWRGPTLIVNASSIRAALGWQAFEKERGVPSELPLFLTTGGRDFYVTDENRVRRSALPPSFFSSSWPAQGFRRAPTPVDLGVQVVHYHFGEDAHLPASLTNGVLDSLLRLMTSSDPLDFRDPHQENRLHGIFEAALRGAQVWAALEVGHGGKPFERVPVFGMTGDKLAGPKEAHLPTLSVGLHVPSVANPSS